MINKKNIAIIGRVPPPYGGVSVHLERLLGRLRSDSVEYDFYDLDGKVDLNRRIFQGNDSFFWLIKFLFRARRKYRLLHFHSSNPYVLIAVNFLMAGSGVRLAYTLHGEGLFLWATKTGPWFLRWAVRSALRYADHIFSINQSVAHSLPGFGVAPNRITWMAAFLPPSLQELAPENFPEDVAAFFDTHSKVIGMQAWFGAFQRGEDIYGLEKIAELINRLRNKYPKVGVCTVVSGTYDQQYRDKIFKIREDAQVLNDWLLFEGSIPAVSMFKRCHLFLRPTISDGDSLSIRECIFFGVPVVASDAVVRPHGCHLFATGDIQSMERIIIEIFKSIDDDTIDIIKYDNQDHAIGLINYYRDIDGL